MRLMPRWSASPREDGIFSPTRNRPDTMPSATSARMRCCSVPAVAGGRKKDSTGMGMLDLRGCGSWHYWRRWAWRQSGMLWCCAKFTAPVQAMRTPRAPSNFLRKFWPGVITNPGVPVIAPATLTCPAPLQPKRRRVGCSAPFARVNPPCPKLGHVADEPNERWVNPPLQGGTTHPTIHRLLPDLAKRPDDPVTAPALLTRQVR